MQALLSAEFGRCRSPSFNNVIKISKCNFRRRHLQSCISIKSYENFMSQLRDIPNNSIIHFEDSEYASGVFISIINVSSLILQILIVTLISRDGWHNQTVSTMFILSLSCADVLFSLSESVFVIINLSSNGWATGQTGCLVNALLAILAECLSILSLALLTFDRYSVLLKTLTLRFTQNSARICIIALWITCPILCCYVIYFNAYGYIVGLGSTKYVCTLSWWTKEPLTVFGIAVCLVALLGVLIFVVFAYTSIVIFYMRMKADQVRKEKITSSSDKLSKSNGPLKSSGPGKPKNLNSPPGSLFNVSGNLSADEIKLLTRSIVITGTYFVCWTPYLVKIFVEIGSNHPSSSAFDFLANTAVALYPLLTGIYLLVFDARINRNAKEMMDVLKRLPYIKKITIGEANQSGLPLVNMTKKTELVKTVIIDKQ